MRANALDARSVPVYPIGRGLPVDSAEFWRRVERTEMPSDPDEATAVVIRRMTELAKSSAAEPLFKAYAFRAVKQFKGGPLWAAAGIDPFAPGSSDGRRQTAIAESAWWWAKHYITFEHHDRTIWQRLRESGQWQLLIAPDVLVRMARPKGDCAVFSTTLAAILEAWGVAWEFVTVAADRRQPGVYSHVYPRAVLPDGRRISLDASHGDYPGWHVPAYDVFRLQVWDSNGNPVADRGGEFMGLHNYSVNRALLRRRIGRGGLRGLGLVTTDGSDPNQTTLTNPFGLDYIDQSGTVSSSGSGSSGSGSSFDTGGLIADLLKQWTAIGGKVIAPTTTYVRGPNGQLMISTPAGASPNSLVAGSLFGSASNSLLWIGGGLAVLLLGAVALSGRGR